jgi:transcriptional regulator GlxA family with amidase domain
MRLGVCVFGKENDMKIAILIYDGITALDAVGPYDMLNRVPGTDICFVAKEKGAVRTGNGALGLVADHTLADVATADVLLVPGGSKGIVEAIHDPAHKDWICAIDKTTQWTTSVCSGALFLGAAGRLEGRRATTHWRAAHGLAKYGATYVGERYVHDGKYLTAAGVSAGIDMALYLIEQIEGRDTAQAVQLSAEYVPQPPFPPVSAAAASSDLKARVAKLAV